ncbi:hypothetical protein NCCP2331_12490 [Sporosarcina sp. NCCP-2331]|nr:hypothetical protein NCCP2331_12490 [Sporosarcina sp. NCCP-2331]GLB55220.1 hypothetical protein NCCP2378_10060 [Sporosarcina sp. NCCP-2378]
MSELAEQADAGPCRAKTDGERTKTSENRALRKNCRTKAAPSRAKTNFQRTKTISHRTKRVLSFIMEK